MEKKIHVRVQTTDTPALQVLLQALKDLKKQNEEVKKKIEVSDGLGLSGVPTKLINRCVDEVLAVWHSIYEDICVFVLCLMFLNFASIFLLSFLLYCYYFELFILLWKFNFSVNRGQGTLGNRTPWAKER